MQDFLPERAASKPDARMVARFTPETARSIPGCNTERSCAQFSLPPPAPGDRVRPQPLQPAPRGLRLAGAATPEPLRRASARRASPARIRCREHCLQPRGGLTHRVVAKEGGKSVGKKDVNVLLSVLAACLALGFALAPRTEGGQSARGECQKDCEVRYQECRDEANADPEACQAFFDACKEGCRAVRGNQNGN